MPQQTQSPPAPAHAPDPVLAAYGKPATVFRALRAVLGPAVFDEAMRAYIRRWEYRHPKPLDLFWTFEDVAKQDLEAMAYRLPNVMSLDPLAASCQLSDRPATIHGKWVRPEKAMLGLVGAL